MDWKGLLLSWGTWCSGITPAQHAGGPGFNPQCVHFASVGRLLLQLSVVLVASRRHPWVGMASIAQWQSVSLVN